MIGTYSPGARMLRIVAEHADAWSAWLAFDWNSPEVVREQWEALQRACADLDRDAGTVHRLACVSVQLTREPFRFGPIDLAGIAIGGEAGAIADRLLTFEDVADEVVIYSYPLTARALETMATVLEALED